MNSNHERWQGGPVLVTGAAGFIGSHVAEHLVRSGASVVGIDNFDSFYGHHQKRRNLAEARQGTVPWPCYTVDIRDEDSMARVFADHRPRTVIHLAARAGVRPSIDDPQSYVDVNVRGTTNVLEACVKFGVERVIIASSSSVYGNNDTVPFHEDHDVSSPISPYAATKVSCELIARTYQSIHGLPVGCLRFFTVYGPRQRPDLAISSFMRRLASGQSIPMFGDGSSSRDYTYIDDIVQGVVAAAARIDRHGFRVWNLGNSEPIELKTMIQTIAGAVGREAVIEQLPMQPGDVRATFADLQRARAELDYRPSVGFAEGVARQWAWMQTRGPNHESSSDPGRPVRVPVSLPCRSSSP